ncbi:radical SAM protein [Oxalobacter paraformigenes]|uniref:Radical SAM additional 4Fe4S-binding domain-containing protein n=1 Tax=Oxalobacter paraformigenes TaxID=556268 RepID=C3X343_9BURK|nr:radical SAM protein [Oxalobacter paraformigenes]EEO27629.1 radical SAM additional 4Fe4S-binding domain-containing protein [Oxalobacter paraformigenes]
MKTLEMIRFQSTYACNLRCRYCYLGDRREKPGRDFSYVSEAARSFVGIMEKGDYRVRRLIYFGAETTLLPPDILAEVCNTWHSVVDEHQSLQTNGLLLTDPYLDAFERIVSDDVRLSVSVSIDGPQLLTDMQRGRGVYQRAMANVLRLKERGYSVNLFACVTRQTMTCLPEIEEWARNLEEQGIGVGYQLASAPFNLSDDEQVTFANWLFEHGWQNSVRILAPGACSRAGNDCFVLSVNADGTLSPCDRQSGCGPLLWSDKTMDEIVAMRRGWFANTPISPKCRYCPVKVLCHSGCPAFRTADGRSLDCAFTRAIYSLEAMRQKVPIPHVRRPLWASYQPPRMSEIKK